MAGLPGNSANSSLIGMPASVDTRRSVAVSPCVAVVLAQEPDRLPVRVGQLDADLGGELVGQVLVPLVVLGEEALVVDVDVGGRRWW